MNKYRYYKDITVAQRMFVQQEVIVSKSEWTSESSGEGRKSAMSSWWFVQLSDSTSLMDSFLSSALSVTWCYCLRLFLVIANENQEKCLHVSNHEHTTKCSYIFHMSCIQHTVLWMRNVCGHQILSKRQKWTSQYLYYWMLM